MSNCIVYKLYIKLLYILCNTMERLKIEKSAKCINNYIMGLLYNYSLLIYKTIIFFFVTYTYIAHILSLNILPLINVMYITM